MAITKNPNCMCGRDGTLSFTCQSQQRYPIVGLCTVWLSASDSCSWLMVFELDVDICSYRLPIHPKFRHAVFPKMLLCPLFVKSGCLVYHSLPASSNQSGHSPLAILSRRCFYLWCTSHLLSFCLSEGILWIPRVWPAAQCPINFLGNQVTYITWRYFHLRALNTVSWCYGKVNTNATTCREMSDPHGHVNWYRWFWETEHQIALQNLRCWSGVQVQALKCYECVRRGPPCHSTHMARALDNF